MKFPSSRIDPRKERDRENFVNNAAKMQARFDESWMATRIVAFGLKGGEGEEGSLSEPRVRLFISRKPVTSGN